MLRLRSLWRWLPQRAPRPPLSVLARSAAALWIALFRPCLWRQRPPPRHMHRPRGPVREEVVTPSGCLATVYGEPLALVIHLQSAAEFGNADVLRERTERLLRQAERDAQDAGVSRDDTRRRRSPWSRFWTSPSSTPRGASATSGCASRSSKSCPTVTMPGRSLCIASNACAAPRLSARAAARAGASGATRRAHGPGRRDRPPPSPRLFLVARSRTMPENKLATETPRLVRIASPEVIERVAASFTHGVPIEFTQRIPVRRSIDEAASYFVLHSRGLLAPSWPTRRSPSSCRANSRG